MQIRISQTGETKTYLSVILFTEGACIPACTGQNTPLGRPPWQTTLGRHTPGKHPPPAHWADQPKNGCDLAPDQRRWESLPNSKRNSGIKEFWPVGYWTAGHGPDHVACQQQGREEVYQPIVIAHQIKLWEEHNSLISEHIISVTETEFLKEALRKVTNHLIRYVRLNPPCRNIKRFRQMRHYPKFLIWFYNGGQWEKNILKYLKEIKKYVSKLILHKNIIK